MVKIFLFIKILIKNIRRETYSRGLEGTVQCNSCIYRLDELRCYGRHNFSNGSCYTRDYEIIDSYIKRDNKKYKENINMVLKFLRIRK